MADRIRLMSHNVWSCDNNFPSWAEKGEDCSAGARVGGLLRVYRETCPDVIGAQEVTSLMADLLKEGLSAQGMNYTLVWGRYTPILYRADKLELVDFEFFTYPEEIEGFEGSFNNEKSKSYSIATFRVKENGKIFVFASTHLWWKLSPENDGDLEKYNYQAGSDEARKQQVLMLVEGVNKYREKYGCPAVIVGDMNSVYHSAAMQTVRKCGFRHAHDIATEYAEEAVGYHYCFASGYEKYYYDRPFETAIDHIYIIGEKDGAVKRFERYSPDYYFPISDHSPAYIDVEF